MKTRRIIYLSLACLFCGLNLLIYLAVLRRSGTGLTPEDRTIPGVVFGYYLGMNLCSIIGIIFFLAAYRVSKKIKRKEERESALIDSF